MSFGIHISFIIGGYASVHLAGLTCISQNDLSCMFLVRVSHVTYHCIIFGRRKWSSSCYCVAHTHCHLYAGFPDLCKPLAGPTTRPPSLDPPIALVTPGTGVLGSTVKPPSIPFLTLSPSLTPILEFPWATHSLPSHLPDPSPNPDPTSFLSFISQTNLCLSGESREWDSDVGSDESVGGVSLNIF